MYNLYVIPEASTELGWDVGLPLILALVLFALAVPIWVALGFAAVGLLVLTEVLPLTLVGEALFSGIDTFALIAIPLFILTGDVLVRSGLSGKLLDVAEATMGSLRSGFGTSTVRAADSSLASPAPTRPAPPRSGASPIPGWSKSAIRSPMPARWWRPGPAPAS